MRKLFVKCGWRVYCFQQDINRIYLHRHYGRQDIIHPWTPFQRRRGQHPGNTRTKVFPKRGLPREPSLTSHGISVRPPGLGMGCSPLPLAADLCRDRAIWILANLPFHSRRVSLELEPSPRVVDGTPEDPATRL